VSTFGRAHKNVFHRPLIFPRNREDLTRFFDGVVWTLSASTSLASSFPERGRRSFKEEQHPQVRTRGLEVASSTSPTQVAKGSSSSSLEKIGCLSEVASCNETPTESAAMPVRVDARHHGAKLLENSERRTRPHGHRSNDEDGRLTRDAARVADHQAEKSGSAR